MEKQKFCQLCGKEKNLEIHHVSYKKDLTLKVCRSCHQKIETLQKKVEIKKELKNPVKLTCKKCGHSWTYKGKNPYYATCTSCLTKVKIKGGK